MQGTKITSKMPVKANSASFVHGELSNVSWVSVRTYQYDA